MKEVFVGHSSRLFFDNFRLLPYIVDPHGESTDGGAFGESDSKATLSHPVLGIGEGQPKFGEGQRPLKHGTSLEDFEFQAGSVGGGEGEGSCVPPALLELENVRLFARCGFSFRRLGRCAGGQNGQQP